MLYRLRKAVAVLLMAGSAVGLLVVVFLLRGPALAGSGLLVVAATLVLGTVGLARGAWWGRMVPIAWST
jgi:hypothetical protein